MKRKPRAPEELRMASNHLQYEIGMLVGLARGLGSGIAAGSAINNALLESFAIHARALLDFLYAKDNPEDDDVIAEDFFPTTAEWQDIRPPKSERLQNIHKRVAKEVAHLTYARLDITDEMKEWPFIALAEDIDRLMGKFLDVVPEDLLGSDWDAYKQHRKSRND